MENRFTHIKGFTNMHQNTRAPKMKHDANKYTLKLLSFFKAMQCKTLISFISKDTIKYYDIFETTNSHCSHFHKWQGKK